MQSIRNLEPVVDRPTFLEAMSHLPGAVALVTTGEGSARMGLTVSAVCSLSAEPPSLIACINKSASAHDTFLARKSFAVNILRPSQIDYATLFTKKGVDRFASSEWTRRVTGAPVLSTALIAFDCTLKEAFDGSSHTILIGTVTDIMLSTTHEAECLVWHQRKYRTSADIAQLASTI